jgi:hypothetical protein
MVGSVIFVGVHIYELFRLTHHRIFLFVGVKFMNFSKGRRRYIDFCGVGGGSRGQIGVVLDDVGGELLDLHVLLHIGDVLLIEIPDIGLHELYKTYYLFGLGLQEDSLFVLL